MGFSDEDQILIETLYVFMDYWAENVVRNFWIKLETEETEQTYEKAARNWHVILDCFCIELKAYGICSVIFLKDMVL